MIAFFKPLLQFFSSPLEIQVFGSTHCKVYGLEYRTLYQCLSQLPCVVLPRKPHYLWSGEGIYAEFILNGHTFQIEGDSWDGGLWIATKDELEHADEMRAIRKHVERWKAES
jgi:hypothetical protein